MFIALLFNPILCFYHIVIHSVFKSIIFLVSGSLIHIQYNISNSQVYFSIIYIILGLLYILF